MSAVEDDDNRSARAELAERDHRSVGIREGELWCRGFHADRRLIAVEPAREGNETEREILTAADVHHR